MHSSRMRTVRCSGTPLPSVDRQTPVKHNHRKLRLRTVKMCLQCLENQRRWTTRQRCVCLLRSFKIK